MSRDELALNHWSHLAVSHSGMGTLRLYINGELESEQFVGPPAETHGVYACT